MVVALGWCVLDVWKGICSGRQHVLHTRPAGAPCSDGLGSGIRYTFLICLWHCHCPFRSTPSSPTAPPVNGTAVC